ncbi:MAG: asparaginase [Hyphomicrobiaceae bacterium]|nr:asparaginase [Hyphomicrobiaceae bacterium]MCC0023138.1 asparaginase [Hyphomicrobiaceae bacterium]
MNANPVLAELVRGNAVENLHRGTFCVSDAHGNIITSAGDIDRPVFPRSAIKSLQALAIFRSGAAEKFNLTEEHLAIACASHGAEAVHVAAVTDFLATIGLSIDNFECGAHPPGNKQARDALRAAGVAPTAIHNNCSGKHSGMLAGALALGVDPAGYINRDHPEQKLVRQCVEDLTGVQLSEDRCGTDGCSIPTFAGPLRGFARGFARMATGEELSPEDAAAGKRIFDAATSHPILVGGTGVFDSEIMEAYGGRLMLKVGAEGVYCGAVRDKGWGFALKCDDGLQKAAQAMIAALLTMIADPGPEQKKVLDRSTNQVITNWNKFEVGVLRPTQAAYPVL